MANTVEANPDRRALAEQSSVTGHRSWVLYELPLTVDRYTDRVYFDVKKTRLPRNYRRLARPLHYGVSRPQLGKLRVKGVPNIPLLLESTGTLARCMQHAIVGEPKPHEFEWYSSLNRWQLFIAHKPVHLVDHQ